jgi:hypothetical protein
MYVQCRPLYTEYRLLSIARRMCIYYRYIYYLYCETNIHTHVNISVIIVRTMTKHTKAQLEIFSFIVIDETRKMVKSKTRKSKIGMAAFTTCGSASGDVRVARKLRSLPARQRHCRHRSCLAVTRRQMNGQTVNS